MCVALSPGELAAATTVDEIGVGLGILDALLLGEEGEMVESSSFGLSTAAPVCPSDSLLPLEEVVVVEFASTETSSLFDLMGGVFATSDIGNLEAGRGILLLPPDWLEDEDGEGRESG